MYAILDELAHWGCDVDKTLERFLNDKDLYVECLQILVDDTSLHDFEKALMNQDIKTAYEAAHTFKGVVLNLGLDPFIQIIVPEVKELSEGNIENAQPALEKLQALFKEYCKMIHKNVE